MNMIRFNLRAPSWSTLCWTSLGRSRKVATVSRFSLRLLIYAPSLPYHQGLQVFTFSITAFNISLIVLSSSVPQSCQAYYTDDARWCSGIFIFSRVPKKFFSGFPACPLTWGRHRFWDGNSSHIKGL